MASGSTKLHASIDPVLSLELDPGSEVEPEVELEVVGVPEVSPVPVESVPVEPPVEPVESLPVEVVEVVEVVVLVVPLPDDVSLPAPGFVGSPQAVTPQHTPTNANRTP
ncbi:hypothetical protein [Nannocystis sp. SCPEA4]|uniref:hypothetical protein n=1 Tax=Nannocystis sp. SCPEA4 TaxID=2996787 RepID=UPI00226E272C|nr:hypothetical protein [Nannocystis sp. SCPEA4]MCY1060626.1 hypothetical protein [Nannocystis sp. SCPEA4]